MGSDRWAPIEVRSLPNSTSGGFRRFAAALTTCESRDAVILATETGEVATVASLEATLESPEVDVRWSKELPGESGGTVVFTWQSISDEALRSLLEQLSSGEFGPEPPSWALTGPGRSPLTAYRAAGPTATIEFQDEEGEPMNLTLFPIRLSRPDPLQSSLTPENRLPEGGRDNLDKREEWFQGRSGKDD